MGASDSSASARGGPASRGQLKQEDFESAAHDHQEPAIWMTSFDMSFQTSSHADGAKAGKQRTLVRIMFCPGARSTTAPPQAVKWSDFSTNNAKSVLAGVQWIVESLKDFKVEKMTGEVKPGAMLSRSSPLPIYQYPRERAGSQVLICWQLWRDDFALNPAPAGFRPVARSHG